MKVQGQGWKMQDMTLSDKSAWGTSSAIQAKVRGNIGGQDSSGQTASEE